MMPLQNGIIGKLPNLDPQLWEVTENQTSQAISDYFRIGGHPLGTGQ
jgi:hypothetical protein